MTRHFQSQKITKKPLFFLKNNHISISCKTPDGQNDETYILINSNDEIINLWFEGIVLLTKQPNSKSASLTCFVECLFDTQLLDIQTLGINIPNERPAIPPLPEDFDFNMV